MARRKARSIWLRQHDARRFGQLRYSSIPEKAVGKFVQFREVIPKKGKVKR